MTAAERPTDAYIKARVIEEFQTLMNSYPKGDNGQYKRIQAKKVISAVGSREFVTRSDSLMRCFVVPFRV